MKHYDFSINYFKKEERGSMKCFVAELYSVRKV